MMDTKKLESFRKLHSYLGALIQAQDVLAEPAPEDVPEQKADLAAWETSRRNRILAGSGDKAALLGTLSTPPTVDAKALADLGLPVADADAVVAEVQTIRTTLTAVAPKVVEK